MGRMDPFRMDRSDLTRPHFGFNGVFLEVQYSLYQGLQGVGVGGGAVSVSTCQISLCLLSLVFNFFNSSNNKSQFCRVLLFV